MMKKIYRLLALLPLMGLGRAQAADHPALIPAPVKVTYNKGYFTLPRKVVIQVNSSTDSVRNVAQMFGDRLSRSTGFTYTIVSGIKSSKLHPVKLIINKVADKTLGNEGYHLSVNTKEVLVSANKAAGLFYGLQTVMQLLPKDIESATVVKKAAWTMPAATITDYPRFGWRGMMFDVSRHFFTKQQVEQFIDNMVKYKFNVLHLHLTDDQGWRIEIKSLPKLTEVGAWRADRVGRWGEYARPTPEEPKTYGGFFTQDDIRELIRYAGARFVNILPEIDVPGHSMAAVASYPELSCTPGTYQVNSGDKFMFWQGGTFYGIIDNTLCPANDNVYPFLDKVFTEVAQLFPFPYIHVGGDECYKGYWQKSEACQQLMKREGLKDADELQSYFMKKVEAIVESKGKKVIGWDEIMEGGLPANSAVMSWRGEKGGIEAARLNHPVVMTPNTYVYVDLYQGDPVAEPPTYSMLRLRKVYDFDPVPAGISNPSLVLGGQCNLWSERLNTMRHAEYMLWPRAFAVSESLWSAKGSKNWPEFVGKIESHFERFDAAETKYARSMYDPIFAVTRDTTSNAGVKITLSTEVPGLDIYYSFDETNPDNFYPKYTNTLAVPKDAANLKVITYRGKTQMGKLITMPIEELRKRAGLIPPPPAPKPLVVTTPAN